VYIARVLLNGDVVFGLVEGLDPAGDPTPEAVFAPIASHPYVPEPTPIGPRIPLGDVQLLAPVLPSKVVAVARNYAEHAAEMGGEVKQAEPDIFLKPSTAVVGTGAPVLYPPGSERVDHEAELAVVIARLCKSVPVERVPEVILGYTCANDVTARDLQQRDNQWGRAKGFDSFCPIGPWIATNEVDPASAHVVMEVNGELRQSGNTADLVHGVADLIAFISDIMTLLPGDVILTGTPAGVGSVLPGDVMEITVPGIGTLRNEVVLRD
jgi:2-keto-4-pentenoate hydratase/2-oxohepta-3-ene-1,7-dioic acid hydratase in catechol pathway